MKEERIGPYLIERQIGQGSSSKIFKVAGQRLAVKYVSMKDIPPSFQLDVRRKFRNEYRLMKNHIPGTVHIVDYVENDQEAFLVMDYYKLGCLSSECLCVEKRYELLLASMNIISKVHDYGIVHRDIKPDNFLLREDGELALCDFSHAVRRSFFQKVKFILKKPKYGVGTLPYMSPEQIQPCRGLSNICFRTDIYSFGVMAYEILTDRLPFGDIKDDDEVINNYISNVLSSNWDKNLLIDLRIDTNWIQVIVACLELKAKDRPRSFYQLFEILNSK